MKKRIYKLFVVGIVLLFSLFTLTAVRADSGWDTDYDSGGSSSDWSSSSSSDWSSSSSSSSSRRSSSSSNSHFSDFDFLIFFLLPALFFFYIYPKCMFLKEKKSPSKLSTKSNMFTDVSQETIEELLPGYTLESLKNELYNKFVDIQMAWMNFDYESLRKLCTDELYNSYLSQLEVLKAKNGQNIMESFDNVATKITSIQEENGILSIQVFMAVSFYDYVIDVKSNAVTRGYKSRKILNNYRMTFVVSQTSAPIDKCPSCGAPIEDGSSTTCAYCGSTIVKTSSTFVLSKKTNIN